MNVIKQNVTITVLYKFCFLLKAEGIYAILMACVCQKFSLFLNSKPLLHDIPKGIWDGPPSVGNYYPVGAINTHVKK